MGKGHLKDSQAILWCHWYQAKDSNNSHISSTPKKYIQPQHMDSRTTRVSCIIHSSTTLHIFHFSYSKCTYRAQ